MADGIPVLFYIHRYIIRRESIIIRCGKIDIQVKQGAVLLQQLCVKIMGGNPDGVYGCQGNIFPDSDGYTASAEIP